MSDAAAESAGNPDLRSASASLGERLGARLGRYHRQALLPFVGVEGQEWLARSHAMIIGCGALGCPAADLIVRAGVGRVSIVDRDVVELTNLQRQTLFTEEDARAAAPKAEAAAARLRAANSITAIHAIVEDFNPENAERLVAPHPRPDVLIDATDNFQTRYLINDVAVKLGVPLIYGGAVGGAGMTMSIVPGRTACLRCVFPDAPSGGAEQTCDTVGVLGPVAAMIAAMQAAEAIKVLAGRADLLSRALRSADLVTGTQTAIDLTDARRADCPCCGLRRFEHLESDAPSDRVLCGRDAVQVAGSGHVELADLHRRLSRVGEFTVLNNALRGVIRSTDGQAGAGIELTVFADGRAIVKGTTDPARARSIYARYVGA